MSDQYPLLNGMPIDRLKVKELRQEPKQRGLKAYGLKKAKMIERLKGDICKEKQVGDRDEVHNENAEKSVPDNAEHVASISEDTAKKSDNLVSIENSPTENELVVAQPEPGKNDVSENDKMASGFSSDSRVPAECGIHSTGEQSPEKLDVEGSFTVDCDHDDTSGDAKASPSHATGVEGAVSDIAGNFTSGREAVAPEVPKRKRKLKGTQNHNFLNFINLFKYCILLASSQFLSNIKYSIMELWRYTLESKCFRLGRTKTEYMEY